MTRNHATSYRSTRMVEKVSLTQIVGRVCEFVFTRQRVDVTDVLSALSYDGLADVWAVRHSVSGGCRATDLKWLSRQSSKRRGWRSFHRSRVSWHTDAKWFLTVARTPLLLFINMFLTTVSFFALWRFKFDPRYFHLFTPWHEIKNIDF